MKIIRHGKRKEKLSGECTFCGCKVECELKETHTLIDRETTAGMATQYVTCPDCKAPYLWVS